MFFFCRNMKTTSNESVGYLDFIDCLGGGFKYFLFSSPFGEDSHFD